MSRRRHRADADRLVAAIRERVQQEPVVAFGRESHAYEALAAVLADEPFAGPERLVEESHAWAVYMHLVAVAGIAIHRVAELEGSTPMAVLDRIAEERRL
jgi:hypothetical protein